MVDTTGWQKLMRAVPRKLSLNKATVDMTQVIGQPFGTVFSVKDRHTGELEVIKDPRIMLTKAFLEEIAFDDSDDGVEGKDNRDIVVGDHTAQKLTYADVQALKDKTGDAKEIIEALQAGSATWDQRTKFSQEKWLKKKLAKYQMIFEAKKPTSLALCEMYWQTQPQKLCMLRPDSLAYLLNMANVNCQSNVLLVDNTRGLVAGALCERSISYCLQV